MRPIRYDSRTFIDMDAFIKSPPVFEECNLGHVHEVKLTTYRIPSKEESKRCRTIEVDGVRMSLTAYDAMLEVHNS